MIYLPLLYWQLIIMGYVSVALGLLIWIIAVLLAILTKNLFSITLDPGLFYFLLVG